MGFGMTYTEIYTNNANEINIIVAAAMGHSWLKLTEDSRAKVRDTIRDTVFALDGGRETDWSGFEAVVVDELRKLKSYKAPRAQEVKVDAPSDVAPQPKTKRGKE